MLVLHVEYDQIVQLKHLVPTDSGLYTGLNKLEQWYSKDIYSMAVDYIADDILSETADLTNDLITKGIVNTVWKGQKLGASSYTLVANGDLNWWARHSAESSHRSQLTIRHGSLSVIQDIFSPRWKICE